MHRNRILALTACAIGASVAATVFAQQWSEAELVGKPAPDFSLTGTDGKTHTLKSLTAKGPVFVVFWKQRCPHNPRAAALINGLAKAYEGKASIVGIVNSAPEAAEAWRQQFSVPYLFLSDADKATIKSYNTKFSIVTLMIGTDGKVARAFPGYGNEALAGLNLEMAKAAKMEAVNVDLSQAPQRLTYG